MTEDDLIVAEDEGFVDQEDNDDYDDSDFEEDVRDNYEEDD